MASRVSRSCRNELTTVTLNGFDAAIKKAREEVV
jgi:hypothetical protein